MPLGVLFAVYDSISKKVEYIPPYYEEIPSLMNELLDYMNNSDGYVLIKAALFSLLFSNNPSFWRWKWYNC